MTANTGNFKKFPIFVNMLWAALRRSTDTVYVDLLTSSDLDNLRQRHRQSRAPSYWTFPPRFVS
jgi:coiled-coil domain-containing protein 61